METDSFYKFSNLSIVDDYKAGMSLEKISRKYHCHHRSIKFILTNEGVQLRKIINKIFNHNSTIIRLYRSGISSVEIGHRLNIAPINVRKCLRQNNINRRTREEYCHKYPINIDQFQNPSNEICAYWLGYMYAKAIMSDNTYIVKIRSKDLGHLYQLARDIGTTKQPIEHGPSYILTINNKKFYNILKSYGLCDYKHGMLMLPPQLNVRHFIRGFIDGNGKIDTTTLLHEKFGIHIYGDYKIINFIAKSCEKYKGYSLILSQHMYWAGIDAVEFGRYLYCNCSRYLPKHSEIVLRYVFAK